ncbi:MAG: valine--tRNA ligase, partial [Deltaproteobacteria bacterium]|nr:valine--tRNA ligase [Deltaproteobacteria bacterium]
ALNSTIQDILTRYHRMKGDNTLWVVGTDHAGIATQNVVERQLKEEGKSRFDLGREKFVERVWEWKKESGGTILSQLKRLGASCDYENERFTMDEGLSRAVRKVFVSLYNEGLIYRGLRLINWCPRCHTALSDLEVEHEDQKGSLWHIKYGDLIVATTRPETMLGDTAVAVHPEDERYKSLIGSKVKLPLTNREIPVIADEYVDQTFGSGVVKITPAHDFNDFEIGNRHNLEQINILTEDGKINSNGGAYAGLTVAAARKKVVEDLEAAELLEKVEPYSNKVGHCYRCKTIVEPFLSLQWFVKTKPLAEPAIEAVKTGKTRFIPEHWSKTYFNWMENITDWCISRQIWWGHQIPAWYCENQIPPTPLFQRGENAKGNIDTFPPLKKGGQGGFCSPIVAETQPSNCPQCGSKSLTQDPDVLDTWFSSALWPFSTLGWPVETPELKKFYPTSVLVTAFDIIFFWVARMMMMGIHFMGGVPPFHDVHIHALVRDPLGQKMSKSKGNVVDPLLMMKEYGTDAFRFTLAAFAAQGRDIKLDSARIEGYRNFCNKIWNASRFAMMSASPFIKNEKDFADVNPEDRVNQWILAELAVAIRDCTDAIQNYEFNRAASALYSFFWHDFCDWYLELTKEIYREGDEAKKIETARTTFHVLDVSLRLMHPFMPFITEEIWQMLADRGKKSITVAAYPVAKKVPFSQAEAEVNLLIETITAIRTIRQETGVPLATEVNIFIQAPEGSKKLFKEIQLMILKLGKVGKMEFVSTDPAEPSAIAKVGDSLIAIPLQGLIDPVKELARQKKNLEKFEKDITLLSEKLKDPKFIDHAPEELIAEKKMQLKESQERKELTLRAVKYL